MLYLTMIHKSANGLVLLVVVAILVSRCSRPEEKLASRDYRQLGDSISLATQQALMKELTRALERGGAAYAVDFCHERATPLTDSVALLYNCTIQRLALRNRNPSNALTAADRNVYDEFTKSLSAGESPTAMVVLKGDEAIYYRPIMLGMPTCLKCHGDESALDPKVKKALNTKYPDDKAVNFKQGDLRGMWKVSFVTK